MKKNTFYISCEVEKEIGRDPSGKLISRLTSQVIHNHSVLGSKVYYSIVKTTDNIVKAHLILDDYMK